MSVGPAFLTRPPASPLSVMGTVLLALVPGALVLFEAYGLGVVSNLVVALAAALATEALALQLTCGAPMRALRDGSAIVTGVLLALALPPGLHPGIVALASVAAIGLGKHAYGGLGQNPFNPAVVGYVIVLVSFPAALSFWPSAVDALSGATAMTTFKYRAGATVAEVWSSSRGFGALGGTPAEWANAAFLAGGLFLAWRRLLAWRVPVAFLATLGALGLAGYDQGSSSSFGSPAYHAFSGGTMLAAWFFATDPVTHPAGRRAQIAFGVIIGVVTWSIRSFGGYPDGIAFGILLANGASAWLDRPSGTSTETRA